MKSINAPDSHKVKLIKTALCVITLLGLGGVNTLVGSSLLDLQIRIQGSFSAISNLVPARSTGYFIGSCLSSILDRWFGVNILMFATNMIAGLAIAIVPWLTSYQLMYGIICIAGISQGIFEIICNTYILKIWRNDKSLSNYVQVLHGAFGIGALITPLISQPLLLPLSEDARDGHDDASILGDYKPSDVKVQWAFLTITMFAFISAGGFLIFYIKERSKTVDINVAVAEETTDAEVPKWKINLSVGLLCTLANTAFPIFIITGSLVPSFAVKSDLHLSKNTGAAMVTVFWVVLTTYKGFFVLTSNRIGENRLMIFSYLCQLSSILVFAPHAASNIYCNWIGFNLLAIGFAPLLAVALSRAQRHYTLTNRLASLIFVNGTIGEAIHPWIASRLLNANPVYFTYYLGFLSLLTVIFCILSINVTERLFKNEKKRDLSRTTSIRSWTK